MSYQGRWPLGIGLSLLIFETWACSATGGPPDESRPYGGSSGVGAGAESGTGPGAAGGDGPGGSSTGGDTGASGTGPTGAGGDGVGGTVGNGGTNGVSGFAGIGGSGALPPYDSGDPALNRVQPGQVCDRLATIQCAGERSCCGAPGRTFDECKQVQLNDCVNNAYLDAVSSNPVSGFNTEKAYNAFTKFDQLAAACDPAIVAWAIDPVEGLRSIVEGTKNSGADCSPPFGSTDRAVAAASLASCRDGVNTACLPVTLLVWECRARAGVGSACFSDLNCFDGVYCDNPELNLTGAACAQRKPDGSPCGLSNECASLFCRGGQCVPPSPGAAYCLAYR